MLHLHYTEKDLKQAIANTKTRTNHNHELWVLRNNGTIIALVCCVIAILFCSTRINNQGFFKQDNVRASGRQSSSSCFTSYYLGHRSTWLRMAVGVRAVVLVGLVCLLMLETAHGGRIPIDEGNCTINNCLRDQIRNVIRKELRRPWTGPHDCAEIKRMAPDSLSGVYKVFPNGNSPTDVYCDMDTLGGGWLVFQKRYAGYVDFYRTWNEYASGFGDVDGEHWLGNRKVHSLTEEKNYVLHIGLSDFEGNTKYAQYNNFKMANESEAFKLSVGPYSGDAGDSLSGHNNFQFSTRDIDHDTHPSSCASLFKGGWWYSSCHGSNLNGLYLAGAHESYADGMEWHAWKGYHYSMKTTVMMFRPE